MVKKNFRKNLSLIRMLSQENNGLWPTKSTADSIRTELREQGIQGVDTKLLRELGEDNVEQSIIGEEIAQLSEEYDLRAITWRQRMVHFLHTMPVEVFMMCLVILDVLIILSMMVLDMYILEEQLELLNKKGTEMLKYLNNTWPEGGKEIITHTTIDDAYSAVISLLKQNGTALTAHSGHGSDVHSIHKRAADSHDKPEEVDFGSRHLYDAAKMIYTSTKVNHILHYMSVAVLAVFVVEVALKVIGYGKNYFKNRWEVIDGVVILISFALDIAVTDKTFSHEVGKTVIIVFLMWRVVRILNAMVLTSRARTMFRLRVLRKSKRIAEDKNKQLTSDVADLQTEVKKLRVIAKSYGANDHEIVSAQVLSKTSVSSTKAGLKNMMAQLLHLNTKIATVSCSSLNKLRVGNGYHRARRPSTIGDETMCHDAKLASRLSEIDAEEQTIRPRAASDAGGITRFSRKLREDMSELKNKRMGSGGITQDDGESTISAVFEDIVDPAAVGDNSSQQSYTVVDESQTVEKTSTKAAVKGSSSSGALPGSSKSADNTVIDLADVHCAGLEDSKGGHVNSAFTSDEPASERRNSDGSGDSGSSGDSGYSTSNHTPVAASQNKVSKVETVKLQKPSNEASLKASEADKSVKVSEANVKSEITEEKEQKADNKATSKAVEITPAAASAENLPNSPVERAAPSSPPKFLLPQISITCTDNTTQSVL